MKNTLSILLVENQIAVASDIVQAISARLSNYRLRVVKHITEALAEPEPARVILLNLNQVRGQNLDYLSTLRRLYPDSSIILLQQPSEKDADSEALQAALATADDFVSLSGAGLLVLGRRLAALPGNSLTGPAARLQPLDKICTQVLTADNTLLAVQLIGADNRVLVWNQKMELYTGIPGEQAVGRPITELALPAESLHRLKDALRRARRQRAPFTMPASPFSDSQKQTRWGKLFVYPVIRPNPATGKKEVSEVCIIQADITDLVDEKQTIQKGFEETQVLLEITRHIAEELDLESALQKIAEQIKLLLNADNCHIYFQHANDYTFQPMLSLGPQAKDASKMPLAVGRAILNAVSTNKAVVINHVSPGPDSQPEHPACHVMCAPLSPPHKNLGLIIVNRNACHPPFTPRELDFFDELSRLTSTTINNANLFAETRRALNELSIFYETSASIAAARDPQKMLTTLAHQMTRAMRVSSGQIVSWDKTRQKGVVQAVVINDDASTDDEAMPRRFFTLADRPVLQSIIVQQRPIFFRLDDAWLDETERQDMQRVGCLVRLLVPMVANSETIGWIELGDNRQKRVFAANEIRQARILANQAAMALENIRHLNQLHLTLEETTALNEVARVLASAQDTQSIMSTVLREYLHVLKLHQGSIVLFDFNRKIGVVNTFIEDEFPADDQAESLDVARREGRQIDLRHNPLFTRLMSARQPVVIDDIQADWLRPPQPLPSGVDPTGGWAGPDTRSMLVIPIQSMGDIQGAIVVENTGSGHSFDNSAISLGQSMADQLSIALQKIHLYEMEYQRRQQAETLREVSFIVGSSLHLNEVLEHILDQLRRVVKYDSAAIHLIEGRYRRIIAARGFPVPENVIGLTFPVALNENDPGAIAIHTRQPLVISDVQKLYPDFSDKPHRHIRSWMGIPLVARDNVIGLISIDRRETNAYTENDVNLTLAFANQVAIALENARLYELEVQQWERELEIAQNIQQSMLPQIVPQIPSLDISGRILPARQIGGDFFHFFSLAQNRFGIAIGDVSGKGIPAALYMAVAMTAIDTQIGDSPGPAQLLNRLQRTLYNRLQENKMNLGLQVAAFALPPALDGNAPARTSVKMMTLASAGMVAPILADSRGCRLLPVSGLPLGAPLPGLTYTESEVILSPNSVIIFTSDGVVEARNETGELFGFERLEATINDIVSSQDAETIAEHIIHTAQRFTGDAEQNDDMTVVVARILPAPNVG